MLLYRLSIVLIIDMGNAMESLSDTRVATAPLKRRRFAVRFASATVIVVGVLSVLHHIIQAITISTGRTLVSLGESDGRLPLERLPQLLKADLSEGATGTLADAALSLRLLGALPSVAHVVTIVITAGLFLGILKHISHGMPFSQPVLERWRWLAITLLTGGAVQGLSDTLAGLYLATNLGLLGAEPVPREEIHIFLGGEYASIGVNGPQWPLAILLAGVIALALGSAFRSGARLAEEADGVV